VGVHAGDVLRSSGPCPRRSWFTASPSSPGATRRRRARCFPQSGAHGRWWKRRPQEGVGGFASVPHWPAPFESTPRAARGEKPSMPLAVRRTGQVALEAAAWGRLGCSRSGADPSLAFPRGRIQSRARTGPRRACRLGGPAAPRPARAGAARLAAQGGGSMCWRGW
jgi:hypothetical protein